MFNIKEYLNFKESFKLLKEKRNYIVCHNVDQLIKHSMIRYFTPVTMKHFPEERRISRICQKCEELFSTTRFIYIYIKETDNQLMKI